MAITTVGRQFVRGSLPDKYKKYADSAITKKSLGQLATAIAKQDPDGYLDILQNLNRIGQRVVSVYGKDTAITLDDIDTGAGVRNTSNKLRQLINTVVNDQRLTQKQKEQKIVQLGYKYTSKLQQTALQDARKRKTGIANQIASGSRGNPTQLMQLVVGDMLMKDPQNRDIPYLAMSAYADGDSPMSNWVSAMSGRKSQYDVQAATGRVGYLGKQASNITHNVPIAQYDCGTDSTGIPVKAASTDNVGALLLQPWKGHPAGAVVTQKMISQAGPDDQMIIRSPITCKSHSGVCALCSGIQQNGKFPAIGSYVALNASKTFIQPLTQAGISCLQQHTKVRMADGSSKSIKDIKVGQQVLGSTVDGKVAPATVLNVFDNGMQPVYKTIFSINGQQVSLLSTLYHKIAVYADGKANQLQVGCLGNLRAVAPKASQSSDSKTLAFVEQLKNSQFIRQQQTYVTVYHVYDIQVDNKDHMFVLQNGLIVSNSKHGSGMGGKKVQDPDGQDQPVGFDSVQRMLAAPKIFPGGAVLAPADGKVADVRQAPQGGWFVTVAQNTVYVPSIRKVKVKPGDTVQAGDMLTNGVPNPMQVVKYKGIGQGRRYFTKKLNQILPAAGAGTMRRNLQQFSRAMINKVRITADDGYAGYLPGDVADYDEVVSNYKPRQDSKQLPVQNAVNTYLQSPVLYYSVGTRVTPSIAKNLQKYNIKKVVTNTNPPPFQAEFIRSKQILGSDKHWLPRLAGQNLTKNLFAAARRGIIDQYNSPSFVDKIVIDPFKPNTQTK